MTNENNDVSITKYEYNEIKHALDERFENSWEIHYHGKCKFEMSSDTECVIYDLSILEQKRNNGFGTKILKFVEEFLKKNTDTKILYVQIGDPDGATEHVLKNKLNYKINNKEQTDTLGTVVNAQKEI